MKVAELLESVSADEMRLLAKMLGKLPNLEAMFDDHAHEVHTRVVNPVPGIFGFRIGMMGKPSQFWWRSEEDPKPKLTVQWNGSVDPETGEIPVVKRWVVKDVEQAYDSIKSILKKAQQ